MKKEIEQKATSASYPPPAEENKDGPPEREVLKTLREQLSVPLTQDERLEIGLEFARAEGEVAEHEAHAQNVKADLKAKEANIRARISALSTSLRNGTKLADVDVRIEADFERNVAIYVRCDNGKVLRERPLDPSERQGMLAIDSGDTSEPLGDGAANDETPEAEGGDGG